MGNKMCNDCWLSMQNCHDRSICCEMDEYDGDQCDWFEPMHIVHGHWIYCKGSNGKDYRKCSVCLHTQEITGVLNYCSICGAKMDAPTQSNDSNTQSNDSNTLDALDALGEKVTE